MIKRDKNGLTEEEFLQAYKPGDYDRPSVTVDMVVYRLKEDLSSLQLLLIRRKNHPYIDCWALPGGFIGIKESAYEAACRELKEETNLSDVYLEQLYTMTQPDRDPRMRVIDIVYTALLPYGNVQKEHAGDDAKDAAWFDVQFTEDSLILSNEDRNISICYKLDAKIFHNGILEIKNYVPALKSGESLAFDHDQIVLESLERMRNKLQYTDVAFNLVPPKFTLPDLQKIFEVISGRSMEKKNFRRKIAPKVEKIPGEIEKPITSIKPAQLYRYAGGN